MSYNYPKLGSFLELKESKLQVTKAFARKVYKDATNVILHNNNVLFVLPITWHEKDTLLNEPLLVSTVVFTIPRDATSKGEIQTGHTWTNDGVTHPDFNKSVKVIKGSLDGFISDLYKEA